MRFLEIGVNEAAVDYLRQNGFTPVRERVETADDLYAWAVDGCCEALAIDLDRSGFGPGTVRELRNRGALAPIIGLAEEDGNGRWSSKRASFLESGGDDCIRCPADPREIAASLHAVVRRTRGFGHDVHEFRNGQATVRIDLTLCTVTVNGTLVRLTRKEMGLLSVLATRHGPQSREMLISRLYASLEDEPKILIIDQYVSKLRRKLSGVHPDAGGVLTTLRGIGFRMKRAPKDASAAAVTHTDRSAARPS